MVGLKQGLGYIGPLRSLEAVGGFWMTTFILVLKLQIYKLFFFGSLPEFWSISVYHLINRNQRFNS